MTTKKNARASAGKTHNKKIVPHCACCFAEFLPGKPGVKFMLPVGYSATGNILCEQLVVCVPCMDRAAASNAASAEVLQSIVDKHTAAERKAVGVH